MEEQKNESALYENQGVKLEENLKDETVWLIYQQMAQLFGKSRNTITGHINNIFRDGNWRKKAMSIISTLQTQINW